MSSAVISGGGGGGGGASGLPPRGLSVRSNASQASSQSRDPFLRSGISAPTAAAQHTSSGRTAALRDSCRGLLQEIRGELVVDSRWHLPFPTVPAAQLLFVPDAVRDVFACPTRDLMQSDIDALQIGILERLNVLLPPTDVHDLKSVRDAVAEADAEYHTQVNERRGLGLAVDPVPSATERHILLDDEDAELVEVDLGVKPLDEEGLPSATLLKNHIYTELGRTPVELRSQQRLQQATKKAAASAESQGNILSTQKAAAESQQRMQRGDSQVEGGVAGSAEERWTQQVHLSFKNAKSIDGIFEKFADRAAASLFGLQCDPRHAGAAGIREGDPRYRAAQEAMRSFVGFAVEVLTAANQVLPAFAKDLIARLRSVVTADAKTDDAATMLVDKWNVGAPFMINEDGDAVAMDNRNNNNDDDDPFAAAASNRGNTTERGGHQVTMDQINQIRGDLMPKARTLFAEWKDLFQAHRDVVTPVDQQQQQHDDDDTTDGGESAFSAAAAAAVGSVKLLPLNSKAHRHKIDMHLQDLLREVQPKNLRGASAASASTPGGASVASSRGPAGALSLQHPENPHAVPVAVLPVHSLDSNHMSDRPHDLNRLEARVFLGVAQNEAVRDEQNKCHLPSILFNDGEMLLRPDPVALAQQKRQQQQRNTHAPATYVPERSKFEAYKDGHDESGLYVLKVGKDSARFARVPEVVQYRRKPGTELPPSALDKNMVIWDDVSAAAGSGARMQQQQHQRRNDDDDDDD